MTAMGDNATAKLLAHAEQVCVAVLGAEISAAVSVSAYNIGDNLPEYIRATHEHMIVIDFSSVSELMSEAPKRFDSFLGKSVFANQSNPPTCLYWGEGEPLDHTLFATANKPLHLLDGTNASPPPLESVEWMKADTILPKWLDDILFDSLGALHKPDWQRFEHNLELKEDEIKIYLGTYFPRSYSEAFCILDALFENAEFRSAWHNKTEITLLDVGTGTGGNIVGLLTSLAKHCPDLQCVYVHGFDGNSLALEAARSILASFASQASFMLDLTLSTQRMASLEDLPSPEGDSYDLITTFKMGGELVSAGSGSSDDYYYRFLESYAGFLSDQGLLFLLDVTTKPDHTEFYPQLLNQQVSLFNRSNTDFATLVPIPCYLYEAHCSKACFTQKEFSITHRAIHCDRSRIAFRILAWKEFAIMLHAASKADAEYIISARAANDLHYTCPHSSGCGIPLDGFMLCK